MNEKKEPAVAPTEQKPAEYQPPKVERWGTLRELTQGGGGTKGEPTTKRQTRF